MADSSNKPKPKESLLALKESADDTHSRSTNPFESTKVLSYNHRPNIVPIYVLDTLSQAHYKEQLTNTNTNVTTPHDTTASLRKSNTSKSQIKPHSLAKKDEDDYLSFANDPFVKSMGNNWNRFLLTIKQPNTYTSDMVSFDRDTVFENKLEGSWGGEERLKLALLGSPSTDEDTYVGENVGFVSRVWRVLRFQKPLKSANDSPKVRSKAGYWMSDEKRADLLPLLKRIFVINPLVPLLLRVMIIFFSACALGLACTIFQYSRKKYEGSKVEQQPSTIMAIVVQCCAIVYVTYISYDEYSGKPLGLRDPLANLSLTFNTLYDDEWVCQRSRDADFYANDPSLRSFITPTVASICRRQRGLAAFLFLVLNLWVLTFTISIIRVVDRVLFQDRDLINP